jgi:CopG family nickel-responsive transcriptional regulator
MERFTISLEARLAEDFDAWIAARGYANRSEAVRDLLRQELARASLQAETAVRCIASLSYVYRHHERDLAERLTALQHAQHDLVVTSLHVHLDHDHCLETVVLRGDTAAVRQLADAICAERGVHHGKLNLIGVELHEPHVHADAGAAADGAVPHLHLKPSH